MTENQKPTYRYDFLNRSSTAPAETPEPAPKIDEDSKLEQYKPMIEAAARVSPALAVLVYFFSTGQPDMMLLSIPAAGAYDVLKHTTRALGHAVGPSLTAASDTVSDAIGSIRRMPGEASDRMGSLVSEVVESFRAGQRNRRKAVTDRFNQFIINRTRKAIPQIDASLRQLEAANQALLERNFELHEQLSRQAMENIGLTEELTATQTAHLEEQSYADVKIDALITSLLASWKAAGEETTKEDIERYLDTIIRQERLRRAREIYESTRRLAVQRRMERFLTSGRRPPTG